MMAESLERGAMPGPRRLGWWRRRQLLGYAYAAPTVVMVLIFFVAPLLLVANMSTSDWSLLRGNRGYNFPENFTEIVDNRLFWPAVVFTVEYTLLATVLLIGLGLGLALVVQHASRWVGALRTIFLMPVALGLASASLLFWGRRWSRENPFEGRRDEFAIGRRAGRELPG